MRQEAHTQIEREINQKVKVKDGVREYEEDKEEERGRRRKVRGDRHPCHILMDFLCFPLAVRLYLVKREIILTHLGNCLQARLPHGLHLLDVFSVRLLRRCHDGEGKQTQ
jgi:hypothetical protein